MSLRCASVVGRRSHYGSRSRRGTEVAALFYSLMESAKLSGKKICGLWIPRPEKDVIYHSVTRGPLHKQQMVLHEVSHMVLRHDEAADAAWQGIAVFREVSGEVVDKALARGDFRCDLEVTAEHLADFFAAAIREASQEIYGYEAFFE